MEARGNLFSGRFQSIGNQKVPSKRTRGFNDRQAGGRIHAGFPGAASVYYYCDDMPSVVMYEYQWDAS